MNRKERKEKKFRRGALIDGALFDEFTIARGYWEAKDSHDDLETKIRKKIAIEYPLANTIFEDTRIGILYQNGQRWRLFG